jgi:hypothetical protein
MLKAYNIVTVLLSLEGINNGKYLGFVVVNISLTLKIVHVYNCSLDRHFHQYFSYIMATSFSGRGSRRKPPTMGKQLVNFITCGCESSAPFL